jgi:glycerate kinase
LSELRPVVIAPDKFTGSLTAEPVAEAIADRLGPTRAVRLMPLADGGEGSVATAVRAGYRPKSVRVCGPLGEPVDASIALEGRTVVVEAAAICGLGLLSDRSAPLSASSYGVGQAVRHALDLGARRIVLAVGGSATVDGGAGLLAALGARLLDGDGQEIGPGGAALLHVSTVDLSGLDGRLADVELVLAGDVCNPLADAAAVYGPQKGAGPVEVALLERALARLACATRPELATLEGSGAAGGLGFAAFLLGARYRPGGEYFLELADPNREIGAAALVVTGEGSLDLQTLAGKLPLAVARRAAPAPVVAGTGRCLLTPRQTRSAGFAATYSLTDRASGCVTDSELSRRTLVAIGSAIAERHLERVS